MADEFASIDEERPLPTGWCWASLYELAGPEGLMVDGDWVESKDQDPSGAVRLIQLADIGDGDFLDRSSRFLTKQTAARLRCTYLLPGDLLIARMAAPLGRTCLFPRLSQPSVTVVDVCIWRGNDEFVDRKWLMHTLNSLQSRRRILRDASGTTRQRVSGGKLKSVRMPVPPFAEQKRIAARVDELFAEIAEGEAALAAARDGLDTFRRALLKDAVTGELTKDWRAAHSGLETGRDLLARIAQGPAVGSRSKGNGRRSAGQSPEIALPELPSSWDWAKIDDILVRIEAGLNVSAEGRPPADGETGIVKISAVTWGEFDESASKVLPRTASVDPNHLIQVGDFLFSRANTLELVGAPVIVKSISKRLVLSDKVLRFRLSPGMDRWLEIVLKSALGRKQIENRATGAQLSMRNISQDSIRAISVPIPPMEEMAEILRRVSEATSAASDTLTVLDAEAADAARLKQSILKAAFEGRLVPQDSTEEPAAALLERLATTAPAPARAKRGRGARSHA
nr:restriction endonuclease subunit S [Rhodopseudomonas sp. BR0C11]